MSRPAFRVLFAQAADAATFLAFYLLVAPAGSIHAERNPLVLGVMAIGGIWALGGLKVADAAWIAWRYDHPAKPSRFAAVRAVNRAIRIDRWWRPVNTVLLSVAAASGIVGCGFNLASILTPR